LNKKPGVVFPARELQVFHAVVQLNHMELPKQVCSLELAKRLKELEVKQESAFYWCKPDDTPDMRYPNWILNFGEITSINRSLPWLYISAFTVTELGDMLPTIIGGKTLKTGKMYDDSWAVYYELFPQQPNTVRIEDQVADTEADARAKMLIYLIENRLIAEESYCATKS
jgi:hypothetical protein